MGVSAGSVRDGVMRWLYSPQPILPLVIGRISFGAILFLCHLIRFPDVQSIYGPNGLGSATWFQGFANHPEAVRNAARSLEAILPEFSEPGLWVAYALLLVSAFCFSIGFRTRTAGWIAYSMSLYFVVGRMQAAYWGWPFVFHGFLVYVILSRAGDFLSVDDWLRRRRTGAPPLPAAQWVAPAWPLRLLQVHLCTMYLCAGWSRIDDHGWLQGRGVYIAATDMQHSKQVIDWQPYKFPLTFFSHLTFILEIAAPFLLWFRRLSVLPYALVAMHLGIEALTNVGWWSFIMITALTSFMPTEHLLWLLKRLPGGPREPSSG